VPSSSSEPAAYEARGELRHQCAIGEGDLYIIGVWESEERVRTRWASEELEDVPPLLPVAEAAEIPSLSCTR
jgi:hypothetical protein